MDWKRRVALLAVPAVLAIGGGVLAVHAATSPPPAPPKSQTAAEPAETADPAEPAGTAAAAEAPEAPEAAGATEVGHADPAGVDTQHDFQGEE